MSFFYSLRPASSPPSNIPNKMPQIETTNLNNNVSSTKWTISQNHALVSTLSEQYNFLTGHPELTDDFRVKHAQKLKEVREELRKVEEDPLECLIMIDAIQRLGIDYYFEEEIHVILHWQYIHSTVHSDLNNDLFEASLRFRLMRQECFHVASDVFKNFKDKEGKFKQNLSEDMRGLMELYEASQLSIEGEDILDEAGDYSSQLLRARLTHLDHNEAKAVLNTLDNPHHKSLSKFMAQNFLKEWQGTNGSINALQELAKMDFKMDKSVHQNEILQISKWWKDLGLAKELKFARDQPLKWYMWPMAFLSDPSLSAHRVELTKPISLIYIIDDIFDVYGTLDELTLFTEAVNRWDFSATKELPDYMKICFKALYDITNDISIKVYKEHGWNPIDSLRKTWATLCNAFLVEAEWFGSGQVPKTEEYIRNGVVSSGVHVVLIHLFFLLGEGLNKDSVDLVDSIPGIISSTAKILRLWDDLGSAKDEYQDGHDGSYVECYMKEHEGSSVEDARQHVIHMISVTWKQLNQECLSPNPFSPSFTRASLNAARMVPLMYNYDQNHGLPSLEEHVKDLLYESVPI